MYLGRVRKNVSQNSGAMVMSVVVVVLAIIGHMSAQSSAHVASQSPKTSPRVAASTEVNSLFQSQRLNHPSPNQLRLSLSTDMPSSFGPAPVLFEDGGIKYRAVHSISKWDSIEHMWVVVSPDLTDNRVKGAPGNGVDGITAVCTSSDSWYVGTLVGRVKVSTDHQHWQDVTGSLPERTVAAIAQSTTNSGGSAVVVGLGQYSSATPDHPGHVFISLNHGNSWINLSGDLPDLPVQKIQFHNIGENHELTVEMKNRWYGLSNQEGHWRVLR